MNTEGTPEKFFSKEILQQKIFSKKPTERAVCQVRINDIIVTRLTLKDLKNGLYTDILDGSSEKILVLGDACTEVDREIEKAVKTMFIEERSLITIKVKSLAEIGKEDVLVKFQITLDSFKPAKFIWDWSVEEKYGIALDYKMTGVNLFKSSRYTNAFYMFSKACKLLITLEPINDLELEETLLEKINNLRIVLYNNMAECHLNRKNYEHTITLCGKVLERDANNIKALYRRGVAYGNLRDVERAVEDLKKVLIIEPRNVSAKEKFDLYNKQLKADNERYEQIIKRMFRYD